MSKFPPWAAEAPPSWPRVRLRMTVTHSKNGVWGSEPDGQHDIACVRVADFDRTRFRVSLDEPTLRSVESSQRTGRLLQHGDLLLEKSGGGEKQPVGAVVMYDHHRQAVCSNFVARMSVAKQHEPRFLTYVHASLYSLRVNTRSIKQTTGIQNLDQQMYLDEVVALPPLATQRAIADFLDRKTAAIDALIQKKEKLIELLEEKRAALINQAVTKGLDPNVPMKDSGIPWIGEIPTHWQVSKLGKIVSEQSGSTPSKDRPEFWGGDVPWVSPKDMKRFEIGDSQDHVTELAFQQLRPVAPGSVLIVVRGMILARIVPIAITTNILTINQDMKALRPSAHVSGRFLAYALIGQDTALLTLVEESGHGTKALRTENWKALEVPMPPIAEQAKIERLLQQVLARHDSLRTAIRTQIDSLVQYRESLITGIVTGQLTPGLEKGAKQ